eukprot:221222-Prymnesium_polylepis.1
MAHSSSCSPGGSGVGAFDESQLSRASPSLDAGAELRQLCSGRTSLGAVNDCGAAMLWRMESDAW